MNKHDSLVRALELRLRAEHPEDDISTHVDYLVKIKGVVYSGELDVRRISKKRELHYYEVKSNDHPEARSKAEAQLLRACVALEAQYKGFCGYYHTPNGTERLL